MIPRKISVSDRITLRVCQTDKFKAGTLSLSIVLPIKRENAYLTSLLWSVLLRGTERYPTVSHLNRRLDYLYGTELSVRNFYRGDCRVIGLCANLLGDAYLDDDVARAALPTDVLEIMEQILFHPATDADGFPRLHYLESEKQLQCDTIRAQKNNPHAYAAERCRALMYEDEPAGVPIYGTIEQVMAVTPTLLREHWHALLQEMRLEFFYVGGVREERLTEALRRVFLPKLQGQVRDAVRATPFMASPAVRDVRVAEEPLPVKQGHLVIGLRTGCTVRDAEFYACALFNELLGGSPVSKLFMNVREKLGLCYSCSSHYNGYKGSILIFCGLENTARAKAEDEIRRQIAAIASGDFTDAEWQAAQKSLENASRQLEDNPAAIENFYFGRALADMELSIADSRARFAAVRREDVVKIASNMHIDTVFFLRAEACDGESVDGGEEDAYEED